MYNFRFPWIFTAERVVKFTICSRSPYQLALNSVSSTFRRVLALGLTEDSEKASIDECFIDFTRPVREELLKRYPHLAQAPPSGSDAPLPSPSTAVIWNTNTNVISINPKDGVADNPGEPSAPTTTGDPELEEPPITWHDIALSIGAEMMQRARDQVRTKLGYSTSAVRAPLPRSLLAFDSHAPSILGYRQK